MTAFIALLRAINVGGTGKLPMAELRALCEDVGFELRLVQLEPVARARVPHEAGVPQRDRQFGRDHASIVGPRLGVMSDPVLLPRLSWGSSGAPRRALLVHGLGSNGALMWRIDPNHLPKVGTKVTLRLRVKK